MFFIKKPIGVITKKKIIPITIGDTIFPRSNPNLNQILFNGCNIFELFIPKIKNIIETNKKIILKKIYLNIKKILKSKKTKKNVTPKFLFVGILILVIKRIL